MLHHLLESTDLNLILIDPDPDSWSSYSSVILVQSAILCKFTDFPLERMNGRGKRLDLAESGNMTSCLCCVLFALRSIFGMRARARAMFFIVSYDNSSVKYSKITSRQHLSNSKLSLSQRSQKSKQLLMSESMLT